MRQAFVAGGSSSSQADTEITGFIERCRVGKYFDVVQEWYQRADSLKPILSDP